MTLKCWLNKKSARAHVIQFQQNLNHLSAVHCRKESQLRQMIQQLLKGLLRWALSLIKKLRHCEVCNQGNLIQLRMHHTTKVNRFPSGSSQIACLKSKAVLEKTVRPWLRRLLQTSSGQSSPWIRLNWQTCFSSSLWSWDQSMRRKRLVLAKNLS